MGMKKRKTFIVVVIFTIMLSIFRLFWINYFDKVDNPKIVEGVLNLSSKNSIGNKIIALSGDWLFFQGEMISPEKIDHFLSEGHYTKVNILNHPRPKVAENKEGEGVGTYFLRILLDESQMAPYSLYFSKIFADAFIYINGEKVEHIGMKPNYRDSNNEFFSPSTVKIKGQIKKIDIVIQIPKAAKNRVEDITKSIDFGMTATINKQKAFSYAMQLLGCMTLLIHFVYVLIVFFFFVRKKELLYLAIAFLSASISVLVDDDKLLLMAFPAISVKVWLIILYFSYTSSIFFLVQFLNKLLAGNQYTSNFLNYTNKILNTIFFIFIVSALFFTHQASIRLLFSIFMILEAFFVSILLFKGKIIWKSNHIYLVLAAICITISVLWGLIKRIFNIDYPYYPIDLMAAIILFSMFWINQFFQTAKESNEMALELQENAKERDEFLANTSHELRNPLHGIINISQTLYECEKNHINEGSKKQLELLIKISQRMSHILNDLLDSTKLQSGTISLKIEKVNLLSVITGVIDTLQFMTEGKNIRFVITISEGFPKVLADENRLFQILFNLMHNAVKYTEEGEIVISSDVKDDMAFIHVKDTGIGIAKEAIDTIFKRYHQGDSSMTAKAGGIGLGLSICEQLVALHGGILYVNSTLGKGSIFTFSIPLDKGVATTISNPKVMLEQIVENKTINKVKSRKQSGLPNILVVEDDAINLAIIERMLEAESFNVVTTTNAKEALQLLHKRWDLVITDVMMPNMSGYELTKRIRERYSISELPILLLTARNQLEDIQAGFYYGANDYVTKPIERLELLARVKALTDLKTSINERIRMEAAWLQAQIQPHFLYNTLNTIAALSEMDSSKMLLLLDEFGNYLRASFDTRNLKQVIDVKKEIELVQSYLYIQQQRFEDRLTIEWDIDEKLRAKVPPLSIQTIVENALRHGILKRPEGGVVRIQIREKIDCVKISISDNGVGMSKEKLKGLLINQINDLQGIGLLNTDKRLKQLYGQGLSIDSLLDKGTTVTFFVPIEE